MPGRIILQWSAHPWALPLVRAAFALALALAFAFAVAPVGNDQVIGSDKVLHMLAFAVLGFLADAAFPKVRLAILFVGLAVFGGLIEIVQGLPFIGRDCDLYDWLADMAALALALPCSRYSRIYFIRAVRGY